MDTPGLRCCDLDSENFKPYAAPPPYTETDDLGFRYRTCERHHRAYVQGWARIRVAGREGGRHPAIRGRVLRRLLAEGATEGARAHER